MLEKISILADLLAFVLTFYNMYKFDKTENVFDKINFGVYMLFWLTICLH